MRDLLALLSAVDTIAAGELGCKTELPAISVAKLPNAVVVVSAVRWTPRRALFRIFEGFRLAASPFGELSWSVSERLMLDELR